MKLSERQQEFAKRVELLLSWTHAHSEWAVTLGEVYRPQVMQYLYLWAKRSQTLKSKHLERRAIDIHLFIDGVYIKDPRAYRPLGEYWEFLGGRWGGRFGVKKNDYDTKIGWDPGHFES